MAIFTNVKSKQCKSIGLHFLFISVSLLVPILLYFFREEAIMNIISEILGNAHAKTIDNIRTFLPLMFLVVTAFIFTIINTIYAYDNNDAQDKVIKRIFYLFILTSFVAIGIFLYYITHQFVVAITYENVKDLTTSSNVLTIFRKCVDLIFYYTLVIGTLFIVMDIRASYVYKNKDKWLVNFAINQLFLVDFPLFISAVLTYFLTLKLKITAEWLDNVYCFFSIGLLVMQIIFSQITFFFLKSKYVLESNNSPIK